jgi:hypothetical protein
MEPTTTEATPIDGAGAPAQPVEGIQAPAAQPTEPTSQSQPTAQADDTAAWLQSKGVDPNDPEAFQKVAKMAYNSEKQMTRATQEASELKRSLTPQQQVDQQTDPLAFINDFAREYKTDKMLADFKEAHTDWADYRQGISQALAQQVQTPYGVFTREQLVNEGLLSLDDVYYQVKGATPADTTQIKTQAQQEVLQTLANTQRAGGGTAQASNPNPQAPQEDPINSAIRKARG